MQKLTHEPGTFDAGECYFAAFMTLKQEAWDAEAKILKATEWRLVHGILNDPHGAFGHAWLENGDTVYDPISQQYEMKEDYRLRKGVSRTVEYTFPQAFKLADAAKTYGYWDPKLGEVEHLPRPASPGVPPPLDAQ